GVDFETFKDIVSLGRWAEGEQRNAAAGKWRARSNAPLPGSSLVTPQLRVFPLKSLLQELSGSRVERFCAARFAGADRDRDFATDISFVARLSKGHCFHALEDTPLSANVASHRFFLGEHRLSPRRHPAGLVCGTTFQRCVS